MSQTHTHWASMPLLFQGRAWFYPPTPSWGVAPHLQQFMLTLCRLPLELFRRQPGLSQLGLVEITPSSGGDQVFFQLIHHQPHLFHLSLVLLKDGQMEERWTSELEDKTGSGGGSTVTRGKTKTEERLAENKPREKGGRQMGKGERCGRRRRGERVLKLQTVLMWNMYH